MIKYDVAGNWLTNELLKSIEAKGNHVVPHYKFIKNKLEDQFMTEYLSGVKDDPTYENYWKREIVRDIKENALSVNEEPSTV